LYAVNRAGNAVSHQGAADWIDRAIDLVEPHAPRICVRGDTDFSLTANFDRWAKRVDFIFGMDCNSAMRRHAEALDEAAWSRLQRPAAYEPTTDQRRQREPDHKARIVYERGYVNLALNYEDVAEFDYQPGKCTRPYRVIVLRKNITKSRGEHALFDEIRYFFYITTRTTRRVADRPPLRVPRLARRSTRPRPRHHQPPRTGGPTSTTRRRLTPRQRPRMAPTDTPP
jgi:hypothetical protein